MRHLCDVINACAKPTVYMVNIELYHIDYVYFITVTYVKSETIILFSMGACSLVLVVMRVISTVLLSASAGCIAVYMMSVDKTRYIAK